MTVPNQFPTLPHPSCRLAILGDCPGPDEDQVGIPFVGSSGKLLTAILGQCKLSTDQVLLANICQHRVPFNDIEDLWETPEVQSGITQLTADLARFQPNCILSLGRSPMRLLRPDLCYETSKGWTIPIAHWRGSVTTSSLGYKTTFAQHPSYVLKAYSDLPYFKFDVGRAVEQSRYPELRLQKREGNLLPTLQQVLTFLDQLRRNHTAASLDIEGYPDDTGITCMSICPTPFSGLVIPFWYRGAHYWSESEECIIWEHLSYYLADDTCHKTCHNGFYEYFVFAWKHRCLMCGWSNDTMLGFWELYPELAGRKDDEDLGNKNKGLSHSKKNLGIVNSLCTLEPYYKDDRLSSDPNVKLLYNFKDSAVTEESKDSINLQLQQNQGSYSHYLFNINLSSPITYLNLRGCKLDLSKLAVHLNRESSELSALQEKVDASLVPLAQSAGVLTRKRKSDPWTFNVKSFTQKQWLLYDHLGFKPSSRWGKITDEETLLKCYVKDRNPLLRLVIQAIRKRTRISDIEKLVCNSDGRIRTSLDLVGTNTGRLSSRESMAMQPSLTNDGPWENTGTNLQNVTKDLRDCFIPDTDQYDFWQFDLRGADAWTVAADLAALGFPTMLEDLLAGIKPAKVLMALLQEYEAGRDPTKLNSLSRAELKTLTDSIHIPSSSERDSAGRPGDWKYDVCKKVQHGCVTADHEVLTKSGWLAIDKLTEGIAILTWDQHINSTSWDVPSKLTQYSYTGNLCSFEGTAYSLCVTHDHRIPFIPRDTNTVILAESLLSKVSGSLPVSSNVHLGVLANEDWIRLLAAVQSDGHIKNTGLIVFHLKKPRKIERLKVLLNNLSRTYKLYDCVDGTTQIEFEATPIVSVGKLTTWRCLEWSNQSMWHYLDETLNWDGSVQIEDNHSRSEITTVDQTRAEVLNTMAHLCGLGSQLHLNSRLSGFGSLTHSVSINQRTKATVRTLNKEKVPSTDIPVYCVTVQTGFFFIRRNHKICITGNTNYDAKPFTISSLVFVDSDGLVDLTDREAGIYQYLYKLRYKPEERNNWIRRSLTRDGVLIAACGIRRRFYGIRNPFNIDDDIIRQAAAFEPQANTTYCTNVALKNLWYDPSNRQSTGWLFCDPLLQIHDALAGQNHSGIREWSHRKLRSYFSTTLTIHNIPVSIPADGGWGTSWLDTKHKLLE